MKLVLIRHGESEWNKANLFTGWTDVELSDKGREEATAAGKVLKDAGYDFDVCYTSYLKRAIHTLHLALDEMDRAWLPVNKSETAEKYGEDQVKIWRRSFDVAPPFLEENDDRNPALQEQYRNEKDEKLPLGESLKDTIARVVPYFENVIAPEMKAGK